MGTVNNLPSLLEYAAAEEAAGSKLQSKVLEQFKTKRLETTRNVLVVVVTLMDLSIDGKHWNVKLLAGNVPNVASPTTIPTCADPKSMEPFSRPHKRIQKCQQ